MDIAGVGKIELLPDQAAGDWILFGKLTVADPAALKLAVVLDYQETGGAHYQLRLTGKDAQFFLVTPGKAQPLGPPAPVGNALAPGQQVDLALRREGWNLALLLDGRLICSAQDGTLTAGGVGFLAAGAKLDNPLLQLVGDMEFEDDFMRAADTQSLWKPTSGAWQEETLRIDPQAQTMQEADSANAFSYLGKSPTGRGLSIAGYWFWSNYLLQASVRPLAGGACGLVAYFRDPDNYLALRWTPRASSAADGNRLQIVQRLGGVETILAQTPGGFRPGQWYKLGLAVNGRWVQAYLDDELLLSGENQALRQGKFGLLAEGAEGTSFDDVALLPWDFFADDFTGDERWDPASGKWSQADRRATTTSGGLLLGPPLNWERYALGADAHLDKGSAGVVWGGHDPQNYNMLRYVATGAATARAELVQVTGGQEKILATAPAPRTAAVAVQLGVQVDRNVVTGLVSQTEVLRTVLPAATSGRVGLYASGPAWFSFLAAERLAPPPSAHVTKEFRDDETHWEMASWATSRSPWQIPGPLQGENDGTMILKKVASPTEFGNNIWWSKGDYYGDKLVSFTLPRLGEVAGTMRLTLDTQPDAAGKPVGGYTLSLAAQTGSREMKLALTAGDKPLGEAKVTAGEEDPLIEYTHLGPSLQVRVNKQLVLQATVNPQ